MGIFNRLFGRSQAKNVNSPLHSDTEPAGGPHESWYVPKDDPERFNQTPVPLRLIQYRDGSGEQVMRLCEDSTGLLVGPSDRRLAKVGVYVSQLRGEAHHVSGCRAGDFEPGSPVVLRREPDNPHDPNAVAVYDATGKHMAAYVNKQKAKMLSKLLDAGEPVEAISIRGTRSRTPCDQVAVLAAHPDVLAHLRSRRPAGAPKPAHLR